MFGRFVKTSGVHHYSGRFNSRGKRGMSKMHKGLKSDGAAVSAAFYQIECERKKKESSNQ
jgi:hypothetical protein